MSHTADQERVAEVRKEVDRALEDWKRRERMRDAAPDMFEALKGLLDTVERLDTSEGVCCCGDDMDAHADPMFCGHSPVDAGHYYHGKAIEAARSALSKAQGTTPKVTK